ncbi:T9SS type A sorting domain-containing protein [candidate division FCPU426 bacterium]|nr:T9SS type A sorting domain-containing protein [candidate division FCPU426 bacterium]
MKRVLLFSLLCLSVCLLILPAALADTYSVTTTSDSGAGSFRQAVLNANSNGGPDIITFSISGTVILTSYISVSGRVDMQGNGSFIISGNNASNLVYFSAGSDGSTITGLAFVQSTGYGVALASNGNHISNCRLGTNWSGTAGMGNNIGLSISGHYNDVGGTLSSGYNVISGNNSYGISVYNAIGTRIHGNYLGTNASGISALANGTGIQLYGTTQQTLLGGNRSAGEGNVIAGNTNYGVYLSDSTCSGNTVCGNYIGVRAAQNAEIPNSVGIMIHQACGNYIGLPLSGFDNIIAGNDSYGIHLWCGSSTSNPWPFNNRVQNNYIGVCPDTENAYPNSYGIYVNYASGNLIGGNCYLLEGNVISGNTSHGIYMLDGLGNTISGNFIGTTISGTAPEPNAGCGIRIAAGTGNYIGGQNLSYALRYGNLISGNTQHGLSFERTVSGEQQRYNTIAGNWIGVNIYGDAAIANAQHGINFYINAGNNQIGSSDPTCRNLISGNGGCGFRSHYGFLNLVYGNYIGTNLAGTARLANTGDALYWTNCYRNRIGGINAGEGNVICGSSTYGVYLADSFENTIIANTIGALADLTVPSPNFTTGIYLTSWSYENWIGLETANLGNLIAGTATGINIAHDYSDSVMLSTNTICAFSGEGIMLASGANNNQAAPGITSHDSNWLYGSCASGDDVIEVFVSDRSQGVAGGSLRLVGRTTAIIGTVWGLNVPGRFATSGEVFTAIATNGRDSSAFSQNYMIPYPATATYTVTSTGTITKTQTATPTHTPTFSSTPTPTVTMTSTVTCTSTRTSTPTVTFSSTSTFSATPTATFSITNTPGDTPTSTSTPANTFTPTSTPSPTPTATFSTTNTPGDTPTFTHTPTITWTDTASPTATPSRTYSCTPTATVSSSATPDISSTPSATATLSNTPSPYLSPTNTCTATPSRTISPTWTQTPVVSMTQTQVPPTQTATSVLSAGIVAYPQPARDRIFFNLPDSADKEVVIMVYNLAGELVAEVSAVAGNDAAPLVFLTDTISPGCYIARISIEGRYVKTLKLVVIK